MRAYSLSLGALALLAGTTVWALDDSGKDLIEAKITLPNGDLYMRGTTDPINDLVVSLTLTNKSPKENRGKETLTVTRPSYITEDERKKLETEKIEYKGPDEYKAELDRFYKKFVEDKTKSATLEQTPVNPKSFGYAYAIPELGPHDLVEMIIFRQPDPGAADAKPKRVMRDMPVEHTGRMDVEPNKYLAAGETSEAFVLPAGKFYRIIEPGTYTIKAVLRMIGDSGKPDKVVETNEETFRVLPYKVVPQKIDNLVEAWDDYERGHPDFNFMIYQLKRAAPWQEIYYVQRIKVRGMERWEWHRLCSVAQDTTPQVAQVSPTKFAILSVQAKGDAGLYTIDFAKVDPLVTAKTLEIKEGNVPKLKVEGENVSAE
ncbi:MAG: hypothetical protein KIS92_17070 [Planctomycetota bacterium]|nr:hypothetical protein [Planctomycetota bacterium]